MSNSITTTLFLLMSVDGKISTGENDTLDVDRDYPEIEGLREGLYQYYEIEAESDLWSLNTGRVMEKIGVNEKDNPPEKMVVSFVIIDNKPHLTEGGIRYLCHWTKNLVLVTTNKNHPAFKVKEDNLHIIHQEKLDLKELMDTLEKDYKVERITIQSGGSLNGSFLRAHLFNYVDIVVAPVLVGGKNTSTLVDGPSLKSREELKDLGVLKLISCDVLGDSYIRLRYKVLNC